MKIQIHNSVVKQLPGLNSNFFTFDFDGIVFNGEKREVVIYPRAEEEKAFRREFPMLSFSTEMDKLSIEELNAN